MNSGRSNILKNKSKKIDEIIKNKFSGSYLNNTKWNKLIECLTDEFNEVYIEYKLIYNNFIEGYLFDSADFEPYFIEPIQYKEVEWIEFPNEYEYWVNTDNFKAGKKIYHQDINDIKKTIERLGSFRVDELNKSIRLYAYI